MLPALPKARKTMTNTFWHFVFEAFWNESPFLRSIPISPQREGREASYERRDGEAIEVKFQSQSVVRKLEFKNATGLDPEEFMDAANSIGRDLAQQITTNILSEITTVVESAGNVTTSPTDGISFEAFLELNSKIELEFDAEGNPVDRTVLLSPEMHQKFITQLHEWHSDSSKRSAMDAVVKRKKQEFDEREASRRMVD